jgi:hypothetical protein
MSELTPDGLRKFHELRDMNPEWHNFLNSIADAWEADKARIEELERLLLEVKDADTHIPAVPKGWAERRDAAIASPTEQPKPG